MVGGFRRFLRWVAGVGQEQKVFDGLNSFKWL